MEHKVLIALIGGVLIGLSTSIMLFFTGRVVGISGIVKASIDKINPSNYWRYLFLLGLFLGSFLIYQFDNSFFSYQINLSWTETILAGLLVGFGTSLGRGCTSGHGVCGVYRFSIRSIIATLIFMLVAMITVYIRRNYL